MSAIPVEPRKEDKFKRRLQRVAREQDLSRQRDLVQRVCADLNIDLLTCAAALVFMNQPNLYPPLKRQPAAAEADRALPPQYKMVRYRLAVGSQHQVSRDQIQAVLVSESGVDKKRIGRIDIRDTYTLVELPDGMPADIFQLLAETEIGSQKLNIKRIKPNKFRQQRNVGGEENGG
ncbi:DbpA RNA binding domain-containing protein [Methylomonas koyamae]|uniref:DbpA RNA binding domain-containing protein n=1 Tax=Methylomonas koyamae TaxID=702114 RepID=UPI001C336006|nr:DbpA RNA binding domain-containing protein [Methylomonas koyamae]WNB74633.1 DbpA RNA binding domain-containing protein [Methylomonas koyamae]BBL59358.1 hypothetical protein MKFW12EY_29710 [Methylomonas koyamae]